jgi:hypothetical protein
MKLTKESPTTNKSLFRRKKAVFLHLFIVKISVDPQKTEERPDQEREAVFPFLLDDFSSYENIIIK